MWKVLAFAVAILGAAAVSPAAQAQKALSGEDPLAEIHSLRIKLSEATEGNIESLRSFQFNRGLGAVCFFDIDDILDELDETLSRVETLIGFKDKVVGADVALSILVRTDAEVAIGGFDSKRRRIQLNARVCGSIPVIVSRAQLALSMLDQAEHALSRLK